MKRILAALCVAAAVGGASAQPAQAWRPTSAEARQTARAWAYNNYCSQDWRLPPCIPNWPGNIDYAALPYNNAVGDHSRRVSVWQYTGAQWRYFCVRVEHTYVDQVYYYDRLCPS